MRVELIDFESAGMLHPITRAYLKQDPQTQSLYRFAPTFKGLEESLKERGTSSIDRPVLVSALKAQYHGQKTPKQVTSSIDALANENTFTIVTGHQLNLFTGPLYFIYKIASVVQLSRQLAEAHPDKVIVPVYWMATEDHDFDEINHFNLADKTIRWNSDQTGAVGRFQLDDLQGTIDQLESQIEGVFESSIWKPFFEAYRSGRNLAEATRILVHKLFPNESLICVDGDDINLKRQFQPVVERELFEQVSQQQMEAALLEWEKIGFNPQVGGRKINLFYLKGNIRERIVQTEHGFEVVNTDIRFSTDEIRNELESHPDRFSPNVVLRPVYQEMILPNLAYIGGGAEVAYWLQLKQVFDSLGVYFPQVMLRDSFVYINEANCRRKDQLGLSILELLSNRDELIKQHVLRESDVQDFFAKQREELSRIENKLVSRATESNVTLEKAALASSKRMANELNRMEKKIIRSEKKNADVYANKISKIQDQLSPTGKLQERFWNYIELQTQLGDQSLVELAIKKADPFKSQLKVLLSA
jgi:bacillithiol biosynthesis cysteine-adding enzyme BshC